MKKFIFSAIKRFVTISLVIIGLVTVLSHEFNSAADYEASISTICACNNSGLAALVSINNALTFSPSSLMNSGNPAISLTEANDLLSINSTAETLASAKAYVKGKFPPKFETSQDLSNLLGQMYSYNFDERYINTFEQQVNSLTVAKTQQLINKYFPKENLQMVIIGKASQLNDAVAKYGKVQQIDIKDVSSQ